MLRALDRNLWVAERPQRFLGLELGARMTVIRLASGELWLHSPVELDAALRAQLDALGPVRFCVAPNRFHHLHAGEVKRHYPRAELWVAPGLERKRADLVPDGVLGASTPGAWKGAIEALFFEGFPLASEVVFLDRASRTLVLTDLAFRIGARSAWRTRLAFRLMGIYGRLGASWLEHAAIRDRSAARASLERILAWDFDRVIMAHGEVQDSGGCEALRKAYAWLPPPGGA